MNNYSIEAIRDAVQAKRPDLIINVSTVIKNRRTVKGLMMISPSVNIAPTIYPENFAESCDSLDSLSDAIISNYEAFKWDCDFDTERFTGREAILSGVVPFMQQESQEELIKMPGVSERFPGAEAYLAVVSIFFGNQIYSVKLTKEILLSSGIDIEKDRLFERALKNLKENVVITSLADMIRQTQKEVSGITVSGEMPDNIYVISNKSRCKGASSILCEPAMRAFAREHGVNEFCIIPSSVHEALLIIGDVSQLDVLSDMVKSVNAAEVDPADILANQAWKYTID